jgi:hypothetical protein
MPCEDCRYWDNSTQMAGAAPDTTGLCRIHPPVADDRNGAARWPFTEDTDWCASFAPRREGSQQ